MVLFQDIPSHRCRGGGGLVRFPRRNWGRRACWKLCTYALTARCGKKAERVSSLCSSSLSVVLVDVVVVMGKKERKKVVFSFLHIERKKIPEGRGKGVWGRNFE